MNTCWTRCSCLFDQSEGLPKLIWPDLTEPKWNVHILHPQKIRKPLSNPFCGLWCYCWCMSHFFVHKSGVRILLLTPSVINAKPGHNGTNLYSTCLWLYPMLLNMVTTVPNSPSNLQYQKIWSQYYLLYCTTVPQHNLLYFQLLGSLSHLSLYTFVLPWVGVQQLHQ